MKIYENLWKSMKISENVLLLDKQLCEFSNEAMSPTRWQYQSEV
jgi:hypothetical protein